MANNELLDKVLKHIEHNEHLWNQGAWSNVVINGWSGEDLKRMILDDPTDPVCGTQRCFAGHAVAFAGWRPVFTVDGQYGLDVRTDYCVNKAGDRALISSKAYEVLEISTETGARLFGGDLDLDDLQNMVAYIKENGDLKDYGRSEVYCDDCGGSGEQECGECGSTTSCGECEGTGKYIVDADDERVYTH